MRKFGVGMSVAGIALLAGMQRPSDMEITLRKERAAPSPPEPRRPPPRATGRAYESKGKREAERRLKQLARIAAKKAATHGS